MGQLGEGEAQTEKRSIELNKLNGCQIYTSMSS